MPVSSSNKTEPWRILKNLAEGMADVLRISSNSINLMHFNRVGAIIFAL